MKFYISYFYQIRNFSPNMIPISTAISDPDWFHKGEDGLYVDKRGVLNGVRCGALSPKGISARCGDCRKNPPYCKFLCKYREKLDRIDFKKMTQDLESACKLGSGIVKTKEEPICVLIVYEAPTNPCSERQVLIDWFKDNGVELREWYLH